MSVISSFIVILLFGNELSLNLVYEFKIKRKEIWKHLYSSKANCLRYFATNEKTLTPILLIFSQTRVKNWISMATA